MSVGSYWGPMTGLVQGGEQVASATVFFVCI